MSTQICNIYVKNRKIFLPPFRACFTGSPIPGKNIHFSCKGIQLRLIAFCIVCPHETVDCSSGSPIPALFLAVSRFLLKTGGNCHQLANARIISQICRFYTKRTDELPLSFCAGPAPFPGNSGLMLAPLPPDSTSTPKQFPGNFRFNPSAIPRQSPGIPSTIPGLSPAIPVNPPPHPFRAISLHSPFKTKKTQRCSSRSGGCTAVLESKMSETVFRSGAAYSAAFS